MNRNQTGLPRPGSIGILIRLGLALLVGSLGYSALIDASGFFDGFAQPTKSLGYLVGVALFSSWVLNELTQREWGQRPTLVLLAGLAATMAVGALQGDAFGPPYGIYLWLWVLGFSLLLAPAHLLAALLRTPGCEMRAYAHLWTRLRGGDPEAVACPGWIDRFDGVRLFRRT